MDFSVGGITIMKSPEGACVELIEAPKFEVGLYSVGTDVNDLDETIEYLKKNGCNLLENLQIQQLDVKFL